MIQSRNLLPVKSAKIGEYVIEWDDLYVYIDAGGPDITLIPIEIWLKFCEFSNDNIKRQGYK